MTYEYECKSCGHQWTADQKISEDPLKKCPNCGLDEAKRLISRRGNAEGFVKKGGCWEKDGYQ